jgi:hypothetical protein
MVTWNNLFKDNNKLNLSYPKKLVIFSVWSFVNFEDIINFIYTFKNRENIFQNSSLIFFSKAKLIIMENNLNQNH